MSYEPSSWRRELQLESRVQMWELLKLFGVYVFPVSHGTRQRTSLWPFDIRTPRKSHFLMMRGRSLFDRQGSEEAIFLVLLRGTVQKTPELSKPALGRTSTSTCGKSDSPFSSSVHSALGTKQLIPSLVHPLPRGVYRRDGKLPHHNLRRSKGQSLRRRTSGNKTLLAGLAELVAARSFNEM